MDNKTNVHWFPGHMAKALRQIEERLKQVDMVIEVCDCRIPASGRNPVLVDIISDKPSLLVLNKSDLADPTETRAWLDYYKKQGIEALACVGHNQSSVKKIIDASRSLCKEKIEKAKQLGQINQPLRAMVVGIPNCGKSTIINTLAGRKSAKVEDRPGITRAPQWVRAGKIFNLMDMPGTLWPKIDEEKSGILLAALGSVKDNVFDMTDVVYQSMGIAADSYPQHISQRYKLEFPGEMSPDYFDHVALKRGCILPGNRVDYDRFSSMFLDELRAGLPGRMTYEKVPT